MFKKIKKLFKKKPIPIYYKVFTNDDNHKGFQYKDGLNTDHNSFNRNPKDTCCSGGLYFTTLNYIPDFLNYGNYIREVIPHGKIINHGDKCRAHKLYLYPKRYLGDISTWKWLIEGGLIIDYYNASEWASEENYTKLSKYFKDHLMYKSHKRTYNNEPLRNWPSYRSRMRSIAKLRMNTSYGVQDFKYFGYYNPGDDNV